MNKKMNKELTESQQKKIIQALLLLESSGIIWKLETYKAMDAGIMLYEPELLEKAIQIRKKRLKDVKKESVK